MNYNHIVLGGTFDRLHRGHISLLKTSFEKAQKVTIGLTTQKLLTEKVFSEIIQPYTEREYALINYAQTYYPHKSLTIIPIHDIYGTAHTNALFDALIVTEHTYHNGEKINAIRGAHGLKTLDLITVPLVKGNDGKIITSTRIRSGDIDRDGFPYINIFSKTITIPDELKETLRQPIGEVIRGGEHEAHQTIRQLISFLHKKSPIMTIAVGDIVYNSLVKAGFDISLGIIDYKTKRHTLTDLTHVQFSKKNQAGTIDHEAALYIAEKIKEYMLQKKQNSISIDGEEDLLALPAIMLAPLHSYVVYGQADLGIVVIEVTEEKKQEIRRLLQTLQ